MEKIKELLFKNYTLNKENRNEKRLLSFIYYCFYIIILSNICRL